MNRPIQCTDRNATSCPICGDCTCRSYLRLCDYTCPLHAHSSQHGELEREPETVATLWGEFELGGEA